MAASLMILCLTVLLSLHGDLFEPLEKKAVANAVDCTRLSVTQCASASACMVVDAACALDPCYEKVVTSQDNCNGAPTGTDTCVKYDDNTLSFCVSSSRKSNIGNVCGFEWNSTKLVAEAMCILLSGCETVTPLEVSGDTYYVCNKAPVETDPCNSLTEEICPYIGKCMWEGDQCVADKCWEKTYSSSDGCRDGCTRKLITAPGAAELGYCKNGTHDLHNKCNAGTGSNFFTKTFACTGYPCTEIVTINNYEGGTLYVCDDAEAEFTVPDGALSLRISIFSLFAIILLAFSL